MARSRSITASLSRLLAKVRTPVYVVDAGRMLVYVNAAMESWLGVVGDEIVGRQCDYAATVVGDSHKALADALCPPPSALAGQTCEALLNVLSTDGKSHSRLARFLPLGSNNIDCDGVICVVDAEEGRLPATAGDSRFDHSILHEQLQLFRQSLAGKYRLDRLIGTSPEISRVRRQAALAMKARTRTIVIGPPGSGREHIARTIHFAGGQRQAPQLLILSCPLLDAELLQVSITSFVRQQIDEVGERSPTLLLCDVDQLSEGAQVELAGFLSLPGFDLQVLSTARTQLPELAAQGEFRQDAAFALSTMEIHIPSLSARRGDIPSLAQSFVEQHNALGGLQLAGFAPAALQLLCDYDWPDNVDELAEVVQFACENATSEEIARDDLPELLHLVADGPPRPARKQQAVDLDNILIEVECELVRRAMRIAKGNKTKASQLLGISRPRLHRRWEEIEQSEH